MLARFGTDMTGWEPANLRSVAEDLASLGQTGSSPRAASDIAISCLVDSAIDEVAGDSRKYSGLAQFAGGFGFRQALRDAVLELRTMGLDATTIEENANTRELARAAGSVLARYEELLKERNLLDPAATFQLALINFDAEAPFVLDGLIVLAPGLRRRGLRGALIQRLIDHGALPLDGDIPQAIAIPERMSEAFSRNKNTSESCLSWLALPDRAPVSSDTELDLFAGSSPYEEVHEALRRTVSEGYAWDDVELVTTDPDTYGVALDTICDRLSIGMTSLRGIPFRRTRVGRCLARWIEWISNGLPGDSIRAALESEELSIPGNPDVSAAQLVPLFRSLEIGWGRDRYVAALSKLEDRTAIRRLRLRTDDESPENQERKATAVRDCALLKDLIEGLLAVTPPVPERGSDATIHASTSQLAEAALHYLALIRCDDDAEKRTVEKVRARLIEIADTESPRTSFHLALAGLESGIADLRAWSAVSGTRGVLSAQGGKLFLTDIANAGLTSRRRTFVLGLDADSVSGSQVQDPILLDADRRAIDPVNLATSADRRAEKRYTLYKSLASLRGRVTLSYAATGDDGRAHGPAHVMLQAFRLAQRNASLGYRELHEHLSPPACSVPVSSTASLDSRDAWLAALATNPVIADGSAQVKAAFPGISTGLAAAMGRRGIDMGAHHGLIPSAAGQFDPRTTPDRVLSPSSLEMLGKCPMAWFYKYGLGILPPTDPEFKPDEWLNALDRGSLLHKVFEEFGVAFMDRQESVFTDTAEQEVLRLLEAQIAQWRSRIPPPNEIVFRNECDELRRSALSFLLLERETREARPGTRWKELERGFGEDGEESRFTMKDGAFIRIRGRIDRVDETGDGLLLIIDYKTGSSKRHQKSRKEAPFKGGRQLQAAIYADVAESLFGDRVARFEYWFPTPRGENAIVPFDRADLRSALPVVESLLDHVATGSFVPTTEADDCRYCEYQCVCRVKIDKYHKVTSPLAQWAKENQESHSQYDSMRARRTPDE